MRMLATLQFTIYFCLFWRSISFLSRSGLSTRTKNQEQFYNAIIPAAAESEEPDSKKEVHKSSRRQLMVNSNLGKIRLKKPMKALDQERSNVIREIKAMAQTFENTDVDTHPNDAEDDEIDETTLTNEEEQSEEFDFESEAFRSSMNQLMKNTNLDKFGENVPRRTSALEKSKLVSEIKAMAQLLEKTNFDTQPLDETDETIRTSEDADSSKDLGRDTVGYSVRGSDEKRINPDAGESAGELDRNTDANGSSAPQKETSSQERSTMTPFFDPAEEEAISLECGQCGSPCDEEDMRDYGKCMFCRQRDLRDPLVHKITNSESGYVYNNNAMPPPRAESGYVYNNAAPYKRAKVDVKVEVSSEANRLVIEKQRKEQQERLFPNRAEQPIAQTPSNDAKPLPPVTLLYKQVQVAPQEIPNPMKVVHKINPPIPIPVSGRSAAFIRNEVSERRKADLQPREQDNYRQRGEEEAMHRQYQNVIDEESDSGDGEESYDRLGRLEREFGQLQSIVEITMYNDIADNEFSLNRLMLEFQTLEEEHKKLRQDFEEYVRLNPRDKYVNDNPKNSRPISF